jgi:heme/copper-type cytochrome/quinol oxidase subunit 3
MSAQGMSVIPYRPPRARSDSTAWLGMVVFLGSWAMMFAALFFAYGLLRARLPQWPPSDLPRLPVLLPLANTLVLAMSSFAVQRALSAARKGYLGSVRPALWAALVLGIAFVGLQLHLWSGLWNAGLRPDLGPYPSVFYGLTVFHALHVFVGLCGLGYLAAGAGKGAHNPGRHLALRLWAGYWHFVGAVWLLMFVTLFVL